MTFEEIRIRELQRNIYHSRFGLVRDTDADIKYYLSVIKYYRKTLQMYRRTIALVTD